MHERRIVALLRYLPLLVVVVLISMGTVGSVSEPQVVAGQDKLDHALAFAAFAVSLRFAFPSLHLGWVMAWAVAFGTGVEVVQAFIPGMDATAWDVVADAVGGVIGCLVPSRAWTWVDRWLS